MGENLILHELDKRFNFSERLQALDRQLPHLNMKSSSDVQATTADTRPLVSPSGTDQVESYPKDRRAKTRVDRELWRGLLRSEVLPWLRDKLTKIPVKTLKPGASGASSRNSSRPRLESNSTR